ncbi:uncharacterized protein ColSpa_10131 [Colletotrichum spaethianum]|uniref:Uncharacterized protein n=1 Tax=Colletotrichum spaethianum TaxID=700344 RepID=A0AA37UP40_9PEZI|nr:uncharacterized protein ColSpa_10131 [Colletotrichum spaethianum]GKT49950.1 hypothetical protein ColSpa_10131 [Colletotrichum spaethianum]
MKFTSFLALVTLVTAVSAKHYCIGGCVKCYCGETQYDDHRCSFCSCNENAYKSKNESNPQGTCDQPDGFHLGCGVSFNGACF